MSDSNTVPLRKPGFDIASALQPRIDEGSFLQFLDAAGLPMVDADKKPIGVTLRARNSVRGLAQLRANVNQQLADRQRTGSTFRTMEQNEASEAEILVACTVSWTFEQLDGQSFPCNEQNARKFWNDDRFIRFRNQAESFIGAEANFMNA